MNRIAHSPHPNTGAFRHEALLDGGIPWRLACPYDTAGLEQDVIDEALRSHPVAHGQPDGRGLWIANQLCDLVQIRSSAAGTVVRMQMRLS